jgi:hypothetical protein
VRRRAAASVVPLRPRVPRRLHRQFTAMPRVYPVCRALNTRVFANTCVIVGFVWLCTELRVMEEARKVFDYIPLRDAMWIVLWSVV